MSKLATPLRVRKYRSFSACLSKAQSAAEASQAAVDATVLAPGGKYDGLRKELATEAKQLQGLLEELADELRASCHRTASED